jgi:hypothetical protein
MGAGEDAVKGIALYLLRLVGNYWKAAIGIFAFIVILVIVCCRPLHAAEIDLRAGSSFGPGHSGPVLGLNLYQPIGNDVDLYASTLLWGRTSVVASNWDWSAGFRACRWSLCASLGASYLERTDALDSTHTNFRLELSYRFAWHRFQSIDFAHISNAGAQSPNIGRNSALVSIRLQ